LIQAAASDRLRAAEDLLGHRFARPNLLAEALTHRSAASGRVSTAARTARSTGAEWVAERYPAEQEGQLGPRHAQLVSREAVCAVAERVGLAGVLSLGANEALAGVGKLATVLADAMEAAIGALFLDAGLEPARAFIRTAWSPLMDAQLMPPKDPKTALQERVLARGEALPAYQVVSTAGPSHAPHFVIAVTARNQTGTGEGGTKRAAERAAAADLLGRLA